MINFTLEKLSNFKKYYNAAIKEHKESFIFEEHEFLVSYAKYLIEYLETIFGGI